MSHVTFFLNFYRCSKW